MQPGTAVAAINNQINFQGKLVNTDGTNVPNGTYNVEFKLYTGGNGCVSGGSSPCGGTLQWTEDHVYGSGSPDNRVTVTDGVFQVDLGSITSLPAIFNNNTIWLSINLGGTSTAVTFGAAGGDGEMLPMIRFTAAPYAMNSNLLDGLDSSAFGQLQTVGSESAQTGSLAVTGNVIANTSLQAPLVDTTTGVELDIGTGMASNIKIGRTTTPFVIQGNSTSTLTATNGINTTTVGFTTPTHNNTITFPDAGGTVCTTVASTCSATYQVAGSYLAKNAADTSQFAVTATNYLYGFKNTSSAVASGVLSLDNQTNTGDALYVTASGNPGSGNALIVANNTASSPSGNLIDLQSGSVSKFAVDSSGNVTQNGGSSTTDTVNGQTISAAANFTGTVTATTAFYGPRLDTASAGALTVGNLNANAINLGNTTSNIATTINGTALVQPTSGHDSSTAFQVKNGTGTTADLVVDTASGRVGIDGASPSATLSVQNASANSTVLDVQDSGGFELLKATDADKVTLGKAPTGTLGNGTIGTAGASDYGLLTAQKFTTSPTGAGSIGSMSVYIHSGVTGGALGQMGIYADTSSGCSPNPDCPSTLISSTAQTGLTGNSWNAMAISGVTLAANTTYWLAFWTNDSTLSDEALVNPSGAGSPFVFNTRAFGGSMPASFGSVTGAGTFYDTSYEASIYATYTASGSALTSDSSSNAVDLGYNTGLNLQGPNAYITNTQGYTNSESFGLNASLSGTQAVAAGDSAVAAAQGAAFGYSAIATQYSTAVGYGANTTGPGGVALGYGTAAAAYGVAIGVHANAAASSIAIGTSAVAGASNELVVGGSTSSGFYVQDAYFGSGVTDASPTSIALHATGGTGSNIAGASFTIAGGIGTGTGNGGDINFKIAKPGSTGSSANSLSTAVTISGVTGNLIANNSVTVGSTGSSTLFKNNGATQNVVCAYTGASGTLSFTSPKSVNDCTTFTITDTGTTTLTSASIGTPTAGAGSIIYISNLVASTSAITVVGQSVPVGNIIMLIYDGSNWTTTFNSAGSVVKLQDAYNNSAGAQPSILETLTNKAVTVQSAISSGMSAGQELFGVRAAQTGDTLGASILTVTSYGLGINVGGTATNPAVQSGIDLQFGVGADRVLAVDDQTATNTAGNKLTVRSAAGNGTGAGGNLVLVAGAGGTTGAGGVASLTGGAGGGGNTAGGDSNVVGGAGAGTGNGGTVHVTGGAAGSSGAGGLVVIAATNGGSGAASSQGAGGSITLQGGNALANNNAGGSISLTAGTAHGTGSPGIVSLGSPVFNSNSESFTQSSSPQTFNVSQSDVDTYGTIVVNVTTGAFTGAIVSLPAPTNTTPGHIVLVSAASGSGSFTLSAFGMTSSVNMGAGNTSTLIWNGTNWSGTTTASSLQQVYDNTSTAPAGIITTSATKNLLFQAGVGYDNANLFQIGNSLAAPVLHVDTTNTATGANLADNSGLEGTGTTGWTATGSASLLRNISATNLASGTGSLDISLTGAGGADNDLSGTALSTSQLYNVSFNIKAGTSAPTNANLIVEYYRDATNLDATCTTPDNGTITTTGFFKWTCYFTTSATAKTTANHIRIRAADATTRHLYIDNLFVGAQSTSGSLNTGELQVGGPLSQGLTIFQLDSFANDPVAGAVNQNMLGSMYYSTTLGRIQCYEKDGWGSCGAAPDSNLILEPEYAGAVLNPGVGTDTHIGTMTANICSNAQGINATLCANSGEEFNYYQWTTSQVSAQTYSIYVKYQLPPTFGGFLNSTTLKMVGRVSSTTDADVAYSVFENSGAACGTSTNVTTSANTWQTVSYATDPNTCGFSPGDIIIFRVDMSSKNNAFSYAGRITFSMKGK
jgi:hypothetical protein